MRIVKTKVIFLAVCLFTHSCAPTNLGPQDKEFSNTKIAKYQAPEVFDYVETRETIPYISYTCVKIVDHTIKAYNQYAAQQKNGAFIGKDIFIAGTTCRSDAVGKSAHIYLFFTDDPKFLTVRLTGPSIYASTEDYAETFKWAYKRH